MSSLRRAIGALAFAVTFIWGQSASSAIGTPVSLGSNNTNATVTTISMSTTADAPAGQAIIGIAFQGSAGATGLTVTDSAATPNTYIVPPRAINSGNVTKWVFYAKNPVDLPGPVTATGSIATTVVAFTTNPGTLVVNQAVSGPGVTAGTIIASGISQWNGTSASATINNSQSVVSETLTVSSTITATWSTGEKAGITALSVSGLSLTAPLDINTNNITGSPGTSASISGTPAFPSEFALGSVVTLSATGTFTQTGYSPLPAVAITGSNQVLSWGYLIISGPTTYATSWVTSRAFVTALDTFTAPFSAGGCPGLLLRGAC